MKGVFIIINDNYKTKKRKRKKKGTKKKTCIRQHSTAIIITYVRTYVDIKKRRERIREYK